jgi:hypothetical protein
MTAIPARTSSDFTPTTTSIKQDNLQCEAFKTATSSQPSLPSTMNKAQSTTISTAATTSPSPFGTPTSDSDYLTGRIPPQLLFNVAPGRRRNNRQLAPSLLDSTTNEHATFKSSTLGSGPSLTGPEAQLTTNELQVLDSTAVEKTLPFEPEKPRQPTRARLVKFYF